MFEQIDVAQKLLLNVLSASNLITSGKILPSILWELLDAFFFIFNSLAL